MGKTKENESIQRSETLESREGRREKHPEQTRPFWKWNLYSERLLLNTVGLLEGLKLVQSLKASLDWNRNLIKLQNWTTGNGVVS